MTTARSSVILVLASVAAGLAGAPLSVGRTTLRPPEGYLPGSRPTRVETASLVLRDRVRGKELPVYVSYPAGAEKCPLIVFSHGAGGNGPGQARLTGFRSSYGYVCLNPTRADSITLTLRLREGLGSNGPRGVVGRAVSDSATWVERVGDINFLLDSLDEIEARIPALHGRFDRSRIGVGGHSLGALTAQLLGGAKAKLPGASAPRSFADPRVRAVLLLSGQGAGQNGLSPGSWDGFKRPLFCATGSEDRGTSGQPPEWREDPYLPLTSGALERASGRDAMILFR